MSLLSTTSKALSKACKLAPGASRRYVSTVHIESDVVIVGGGPAGLALASALGSSKVLRESISVTLVEAGDLSKIRHWSLPEGSFSNRVSSITNASQRFLSDIGAWDHVESSRTGPVEHMQVWDGISDARISFNASELGIHSDQGVPQMARLTENLNLQRGLIRHLDTIPEVNIADKVRVSAITKEEGEGGWPLVHLTDGKIIRARLLVGADGFNSPVRSYAGINSFGWSYETQALVATLNHAPRGVFQSPNTTAFQRFLPTGPIAFLPLSPTSSSLVWSTKPRIAAAITAAGPAVLASMVNAAFRLPDVSMRHLHNTILEAQASGTPITNAQIVEEIEWREQAHQIDATSAYASASASVSVGIPPENSDSLPPLAHSVQEGTLASFPLRYNHTDSYLGEGAGARTVLVGDAAHTVHPLAGQGLNMGLADVESLARCIETAVSQGGDIGSYTALLPYAQERYFENHKLMSVFDKLHKIYSTTFEPLVWARTVGLEVVNELDSVKAALMASAGGRETRGPQGLGWDLAAKGVQGLAGGMTAGKLIAGSLAGVVGSSLRDALTSAYRR